MVRATAGAFAARLSFFHSALLFCVCLFFSLTHQKVPQKVACFVPHMLPPVFSSLCLTRKKIRTSAPRDGQNQRGSTVMVLLLLKKRTSREMAPSLALFFFSHARATSGRHDRGKKSATTGPTPKHQKKPPENKSQTETVGQLRALGAHRVFVPVVRSAHLYRHAHSRRGKGRAGEKKAKCRATYTTQRHRRIAAGAPGRHNSRPWSDPRGPMCPERG